MPEAVASEPTEEIAVEAPTEAHAALADDAEFEITIEGDAPASSDDAEAEPDDKAAPSWLRGLRKANAEKERRIRELERQLQSATPAPAAVVVGEEPTFENCGYDGAKFASEYKAWVRRAQEAEQQRNEAEAKQKAAGEEWSKKVTTYQSAKANLRVKDFDAAEAVVTDTLTQLQQSILMSGADKPELIVYALGNNPGKARELAAIKDPVKFAFALSKLEDKLKVAPRKPQTQPEVRLPAGGRTAGDSALESNPDKHLAKLRDEALKTGDLSKVIAYKRDMKARAA